MPSLHPDPDRPLSLPIVESLIDAQLIRNMRDRATSRCSSGHLSLFLALTDSWLKTCEEFARRHHSQHARSQRFDASAFDRAYSELLVIATPNIANKPYPADRLEHLLDLFDVLGLTKSRIAINAVDEGSALHRDSSHVVQNDAIGPTTTIESTSDIPNFAEHSVIV